MRGLLINLLKVRNLPIKGLFVGIIFLHFACSSGGGEQQEITEENVKPHELVGKWQNLSIIVRMPDSTAYVPQESWEEILQIKPIITAFNADGSFVSEYRSLEDSVIMTSTGTWQADADSLTMISEGQATRYFFSVDGDTVTFRGFLDWDQDGLSDDHYAGKQIRLKE